MSGPLRWFGGKGQMVANLLPLFPPAKLYVEPFFGGGSVFFAIPPGRYRAMVVNDLNHELVTFFRVLRNQPAELERVLRLTPHSLEEYKSAYEPATDDVDVARRFWMKTRQSFGGIAKDGNGWARSTPGSQQPERNNVIIDRLHEYAYRLSRIIEIENRPAWEVIDSYAKPETFIYCDPPYVLSSRVDEEVYQHEMSDEMHRTFAASCVRATEEGAMVAISGYPNPLYNELFAGWHCFTFEVSLKVAPAEGRVGVTRTEALWTSYDPASVGAVRAPAPKALSAVEKKLLKASQGGRISTR